MNQFCNDLYLNVYNTDEYTFKCHFIFEFPDHEIICYVFTHLSLLILSTYKPVKLEMLSSLVGP